MLLLLLGICLASVGLWNAPIPTGDEGIHLLQAYGLLESHTLSSNAYYSLYALLLGYVTEDPINAFLWIRFLLALLSGFALYAVLSQHRNFSKHPLAVVTACLFWASSNYVMPYHQYGNVNLLGFSMALIGLACLLRYRTLNALLAFMLCALWATKTRPEYLASIAAVLLCYALFACFWRRSIHGIPLTTTTPSTSAMQTWLKRSILIALLAISYVGTSSSAPAGGGFNTYLLQGLGQCYAVFYREEHPEILFDPMTEYYGLLDEVFGSPKTFTEALANNPKEAARYFIYNSANNLKRLIPAMFKSKSKPKTALVFALLIIGTALGICHWHDRRRRRQASFAPLPARQAEAHQIREEAVDWFALVMLAAFATAASAAIILLIPDARYWIAVVPLAYAWLVWAIIQIFQTPRLAPRRHHVFLLIFAVLAIPHMMWAESNRASLDVLQNIARDLPANPTIAGNFVSPLTSIVFRGKAKAVNMFNGFSVEDIRAKRYDIIVMGGLENTRIGREHPEFWKAFSTHPENFGYRAVKNDDGEDSRYVVRIMDGARP